MDRYLVFKNESAQASYNWFVVDFKYDAPKEGAISITGVVGTKGIVLAYFINPEDAYAFCKLKTEQDGNNDNTKKNHSR